MVPHPEFGPSTLWAHPASPVALWTDGQPSLAGCLRRTGRLLSGHVSVVSFPIREAAPGCAKETRGPSSVGFVDGSRGEPDDPLPTDAAGETTNAQLENRGCRQKRSDPGPISRAGVVSSAGHVTVGPWRNPGVPAVSLPSANQPRHPDGCKPSWARPGRVTPHPFGDRVVRGLRLVGGRPHDSVLGKCCVRGGQTALWDSRACRNNRREDGNSLA